ncbi:MAG: RiPP maturation radical SAM C-methyltransferase [Deltaproteobacteria bacterium]|nr:RiPP maturation radical SAM C-methyltransferase [Deltaproteobacteria bacterium]
MGDPLISLPPGEVLLLVPPGAHADRPALGVHAIQATARAAGHDVRVLYANLLLAARLGEEVYAGLCDAPLDWFLTERLFARALWGQDALHTPAFLALLEVWAQMLRREAAVADGYRLPAYPLAALERAEAEATALVEELSEAIATAGFSVVGATTTYDQTNAAMALLTGVKRRAPQVFTLLGGRNTDGPMAQGLASLSPEVPDLVVSGEADEAFPALLARLSLPHPERVLSPPLVQDLDALPAPDLSEFFAQRAASLPDASPPWLVYEGSRGCWWGTCRFCGLVGTGLTSREKSPGKVVEELRTLTDTAPVRRISMADNTLPRRAHQELLPALATLREVELFYEVRPDLTPARAAALYRAGVRSVQPGIEALSTPLLRLMRKGSTAGSALRTLRACRVAGLDPKWNLLFGVPGDAAAHYRDQLALFPLIEHLTPPVGLGPIALERFSTWVDEAEAWGIANLRPRPGYREVFPPHADLDRLAYWFEGEIPSASLALPELQVELADAVQRWREAWLAPTPPTLRLSGPSPWTLLDTRGGRRALLHLSPAQAEAILTGGDPAGPAAAWALRRGYLALLDGKAHPIALAAPSLLSSGR